MDERKEMDLEAEEKISVEVPVETDITLEKTPKGVFEIGEISERRKANRKVFRMNNGSEKAIIYPEKLHMFNSETEEYEDVDNSLYEDEEEKCFKNGRNDFVAKISNDDANDELFTIEKDAHRITVSAKRSKKQISSGVKLMPKKVIHKDSVDTVAKDAIIFNDAENGADFEYSVNGNGIKENIIVKSKANVYRYAFILDCVNVVAEHIEDRKCVMFNDIETGEPVFNIPAPFMIDATGETSTAVFYEVKTMGDNKIGFTITADSEWINSEDRAFPVTIDPQIKVSSIKTINTFSCSSGTMSDTTESCVGVMINNNGVKEIHRMYIDVVVPSVPNNAKINKVEFSLSQISGIVSDEKVPNIAIYETNTAVTVEKEPSIKTYPIDFAKMQSGANTNAYVFDITDVVSKAILEGNEKVGLAIVSMNEATQSNNYAKIAGTGCTVKSEPVLSVIYDVSYAIGSGEAIHSHELGRLGTGMVDLCSRKLMIDSEDFAWGGNRMPVTIKHLYDSALHNCQYSYNSALGLYVPNFAAMKLGYGWRLNLMQSIKAGPFFYNGSSRNGYIFINENGEEEYFLQSDERKYDASAGCYYNLYKSVDNSDIVYDPEEYTITTGEETYKFSSDGKLISIEDKYGNRMVITYTSGRITSVTDGAGREFEFEYINNGFLKSISLPETDENGNHYCISYTYTDNLLSEITYPDGRMVSITSIDNKPSEVILKNSNGESIYKVAYEFEGAYIKKVSEFGVENGEFVAGPSSEYAYSAASKRAQITTTEPADETDGETVTKTVYTFDDEGSVISKYAYIEDIGNVSVGEMSGSINPLAGEGNGIVSNIVNLLKDHGCDSTVSSESCAWTKEGTVSFTANRTDTYSMHGRRSYRLKTSGSSSIDCGIYQETEELAAGEYTFSAYIKTKTDATGDVAPGAFVRVTKETTISDSEEVEVTVLAESEHLTSTEGEFIRLIAPFELDASSKVKVHILANGLCDVYVDSAQLENSPYANDYNHLENSNFEKSEVWSLDTGISYDTSEKFNGTRSMKIVGDLASARCIAQNVDAKYNKTTRETFVLSGWAKGYGITAKERDGINTPQFRLAAAVFYADSVADTPNYEEFVADFSPCTDDWQFASVEFAKTQYRTVDHIEVYCDYNYNAGVVHFDDIQLVRTNIETGLTAADFAVEPEDDGSEEETTEITTETTPEFTEAVDIFGNTITETTFEDGEFGTIYRAFTYGEDGNALVSEKDARGNATNYDVDDETSRNKEVTDRCGNKTAYEYDAAGRTTKVISKNSEDVELARVSYKYDSFNNLTRINRGDGMSYGLTYNAFHNLEAIGIMNSGAPLVQYTYKNGNGRLKAVTYANGDTMKVTYNSVGQMTSEKWYNSAEELIAHYKYVYDGQGNIVRSLDFVANKEYTYTYEAGRLIRAAECDIVVNGEMVVGKTVVASIMYIYDSEGQLTKKRIIPVNGEEQVIFYQNSDDKNTVVKFKVGDRTVTSHSKSDNFGRKVFDELQLETGFVSRQFTYHQGEKTEEHVENGKLKSSPTTQLVKEIILSGGRTLAYEYDAEERITKATDSVDGVTEYTYDALGQLLTETVNGEVVTEMTYDNYGNILTKNGKVYTYGSGVWRDLLTSVNGATIVYDAQGNPTRYLGHTLTWEKGRQLKSFDNNTYTYNANGIRTSKTVGGVKHTYTLDGTKILRETWGDNTLVPVYDNEDSVCGIIYNDAPYYFQKNLQGDIIAITDANGDVIARYSYDVWGGCVSIAGDEELATVNPFRYRSYYFDTESSFYYLQSRYYDAEAGRFINVDDFSKLSEDGIVFDRNLFSYCKNNPVCSKDEFGYFGTPIQWLFAAIGAVAGWFLGDYIAKKLGYYSGWTYWAIRVGVIVGGAVIGWFAAKLLTKILQSFLNANKSIYNKLPRLAKKFLGLKCFVAGTLVYTSEGEIKIEEICVGDYVLTYNFNTGNTEYNKVLQVFENTTNELTYVCIENEEIVSTPSHRYFVVGKGWIKAAEIIAGDMLCLPDDSQIVVNNVYTKRSSIAVPVYNLNVENQHNYYVSKYHILVHNLGCDDVATNTLKKISKSQIKQLGGEKVTSEIKKQFGKSLSNLYVDSKGNVYVSVNGSKIAQWVGDLATLAEMYR